MTDHCFISYSTADALDFATKLSDELEGGYPYINVWFDKRDLRPGMEWDVQIDDGLKNCKILLFAMTKDSTNEKSVCKQEWSRALSYKKTVIPLLLHRDVNTPFRLGDRQRIDFTGGFEAGLAQLRRHIAWMDSPEGIFQALKDRLSDAERDIQRAADADKPRIQSDIDDLKAQIKRQEEIVKNPKAAEEQTEKNIQAGLERERQPEKPVAAKTTTKFINPPPGIAPIYFQDRYFETSEIVKFLKDDSKRLMTVVGRGGVGKTAMVCRLLKALESGSLPDKLGDMKIDGIVYLSESGSHRVNFPNIFADLSKLLPSETADKLDALYKDPMVSVVSKMNVLLEHFQGERVLLLLDNFEPIVDPETQSITNNELDEALRALISGPHHLVNALITTRVAPRELNLREPGRQRVLILDEGLGSPYAENILREMDEDGKLGLKAREANDPLLQSAREKTRGYPRALEALFAILSSDRYTTLAELLEMSLLPENVVEALVGEAFSRLDATAQKVMQALTVYNRPVTPAAVDYLLQPHIPEIDSAPILNRLVNMHFVRRETGRYYLHPVDREYAFARIPVLERSAEDSAEEIYETKDKEALAEIQSQIDALRGEILKLEFTQHQLLTRAADYFAQARKPREEWKKLDDLAAQLAEIELRCEAGDYDTAFGVLGSIDFDYLRLWGHYRLRIHLHLRMKDKLEDKTLTIINLQSLGSSNRVIGNIKEALVYHDSGLEIAREMKNRVGEVAFLNGLGLTHFYLGDESKSIKFYEQGANISREIGSRYGEGDALTGLGNIYARLGDIKKAIEFHEQALLIYRESNNEEGQGILLNNLGNKYLYLGDTHKCIELYKQALVTSRQIKDRSTESYTLSNIGLAHIDLYDYQSATKSFVQSIEIADSISLSLIQKFGREGLAQAYLLQTEFISARATTEAALQYNEPRYNHSTNALHGIITLRQEDVSTARQAFTRAIAQADELLAKTPEYYDALDAKGLALCGLVLVKDLTGFTESLPGGETPSENLSGLITQAIETFRAARVIAPHAGVVKSVLRLFDELAKCDPEGLLEGVRAAVEGVEG